MQRKRSELVPIGEALSDLGGAVTFAPSLWTVTVTKRKAKWWNRLRKHPFVDSIIKRMVSETVKELVDRAQDWARDFVPQLFQRGRTDGRINHAASTWRFGSHR